MLRDLGKLTPDQQLERIADRIARIPDPALRAATAMELFGKTGTALLPLMLNGASGIQEPRSQAYELVISSGTNRSTSVTNGSRNISPRSISSTKLT